MTRLALLLSLFACAALAEEDEVRFRPKTYRPAQALKDNAYQSAVYTPAPPPAAATRRPESRGGFWSFFTSRPLDAAPAFKDAPPARKTPYEQHRQVVAASITPDPGAAAEHKPFVEGANKLEAAGYTPPEKPREKNPLLAPRQGIKEPE